MVKLEPGSTPDEVLFTEAERKAVTKASTRLGYSHVSTFIREMAYAVSPARGRVPARARLLACAEACQYPLGRWLREVVLAGIAHPSGSKLPEHQDAARAWVAGFAAR